MLLTKQTHFIKMSNEYYVPISTGMDRRLIPKLGLYLPGEETEMLWELQLIVADAVLF